MNQGRTTGIFALVAAVTFAAAWWSRPAAVSTDQDLKDERLGEAVFVSFEDPSVASSFQIIKYDETMGTLKRFEVARDNSSGMWKLPSYDNYPADAAEQVRDATTPLVGLRILSIPSIDRGDHPLYGVVNPDDDNLSVSETGVGMLVRVKDSKDEVLASLIIGKEVGQTEGQRYVRVPTEDAVYVVELDTTPFTTEFESWIKGELLGVRSFDITRIGLRDYALVPVQQGYSMSRNFDADLAYNRTDSKWELDRLISYESGAATATELSEGEELNSTALNDLRNSVQDLKIVDVIRKPTGLASDLKADKSLLENQESLQSLMSQGFVPQQGDAGVEIFATGGETIVGTDEGVKYLLRFGESTQDMSGIDEDDSEEIGLNRYLLVTATLDDNKFPAPELEPLPETVEEMLARERGETLDASGVEPGTEPGLPELDPADAAAATNMDEKVAPPTTEAGATSGESEAATETPAKEPKLEKSGEEASKKGSEEGNPEGESPETEEANTVEANTVEPNTAEPTAEEPPAGEGGPDGEASELGGDENLDACGPIFQEGNESQATESQETKAEEAESQETTESENTETAENTAAAAGESKAAAEQPQATEPQETEEELKERLEAVREEIAKENQRKIDERNEKMDEARKKVQELNARFADWYYVVSNSVYKKLTLERDQLIQGAGAGNAAPPAGMPGGGFPQLPPGIGLPQGL